MAAVSLIAVPGASAKEVAGVVTSVSGTWFVEGVKLSPGQKLSAGAVIKAKEPNTKYGRVVIMLLDFSEVSRICDRRGFCGEPIKLPDAVNQEPRAPSRAAVRPPGFWERLVSAINMSRRRGQRMTAARGSGSLPDQVVKLESGRVDLGPVFSGVAARKILLNIEAVGSEAGETSVLAVERLPLSWRGRGRAVIKAPNLKPGLYRITFLTPDGAGGSPPPGDVWALVVESSKYQRLAAEYRMARAFAANWDSKTEPKADDFLRAFLEALANEKIR